MKKREFTAVYKKSGRWIAAWIEEIPGVNTQGRTLKEAKDNLREALLLTLEAARDLNKKYRSITRRSLSVSSPR